jgi:Mce-associated membrane protein
VPEPEVVGQANGAGAPEDVAIDLTKKAEAEPDAGTAPGPVGDPAPGPAAQRSTRPLVLLGAAAVALGAFAAVAAFQPGAKVENRAWVDAAATRDVQRAATQAIETMHGYDYETIDADFDAIRNLLTPEMQEQFDRTAEVTKQAAVQTHTVTQVAVTHIGTSMLDDSRAEVAAYINVSATGDGIAQGSAAAPLLVRMEKIDGRWLVSGLTDS